MTVDSGRRPFTFQVAIRLVSSIAFPTDARRLPRCALERRCHVAGRGGLSVSSPHPARFHSADQTDGHLRDERLIRIFDLAVVLLPIESLVTP